MLFSLCMAQSNDFINKMINFTLHLIDMFTYIFYYSHIYVVDRVRLIIVGDLVCKARFTHRGLGHRFLDELSHFFTNLYGSTQH